MRGAGTAKLSATCLEIAACFSTATIIRRSNVLQAKRKSFLTAYKNISLEGTKITRNREYTQLSAFG